MEYSAIIIAEAMLIFHMVGGMVRLNTTKRAQISYKQLTNVYKAAIFVGLGLFWYLLPLAMLRAAETPHWLSERPSAREAAQLSRLKGIGYTDNPRLYIRIFKEEKLLEVWIKGADRFKLYRSYEICRYSGELGPKLAEGDRQAPEGFYHIPAADFGWRSAKWPRALNLSFPNIFDALKERTGSYLLIHGGCSSKGCYALEDGPMDELFALVSLATRSGQSLFPVHIFPFRLTEDKWKTHKKSIWSPFWQEMQPVYDYFNRQRQLPVILVCESGYKVMSFLPKGEERRIVNGDCLQPLPLMSEDERHIEKLAWVAALAKRYQKLRKSLVKSAGKPGVEGQQIKVACNLRLASCRRWLALRKRMLKRGTLPKSLLKQ